MYFCAMDKVIKLYKWKDGVNDPGFPSDDEQIITSDFTYTAKRMGGAPTITCTMRHKDNLDALWDENVYAEFNDERYYLHRTPTNTYDNTDIRYKYDVELVSERIILDSVYFIDVDPRLEYKGVTNSPSFSFHGDVVDFAKKLNYALQYAKLQSTDGIQGYIVIIDKNTTIGSEKYIVNFENQYISSAIQEIYNTFKLPYYFKGKEIHIGESDSDTKLDTVLKYGDTESLLSISKQNANHMVVNRITGVGSSDNIPYYYPNETPLGEVEARAIQSNMTLEDKDFIVVNSDKLTRLGLKEEGDDGNVVILKKYETNAVVDDNDKEYTISKFDYLYTDTTGTKVWRSAYIGNFYLAAYPYEGGSSGSNNEKLYSYKYHVRLKFKVKANQSGVMRWMWKANPNFDSISEQKRKYGNFIEKFFDNLEAYEVVGIDNQERKIDINMVGAYPNLYLDTPFLGSSNGKGRDVEIHIKFEFSKQALNNQILVSDIQNTTFTSISLLKEDVGSNVYYWESPKASYSDIREFGVDLTDNAKNLFLTNPEKLRGDGFFLEQKKWIAPQTNLMPPIYRNDGTERFYNAENFKYPVIVDGKETGYYQFPNPYVDGNPHEYIQNFDDIKPTIEGMVNGHGDAINKFIAFAYDEGDNDSVDKDGNLLHPYFFAKLTTFDQSAEFNLFDHAIENGPMQITMTSGQCSGCTFQIMVDKDTQKNTVQVDSEGNLVRDSRGNVVVVGEPQDRQNNTINNKVWIALHKDVDTLPSVMPNMGSYNKPSIEDTFAILNISLPQAYIESAEKRLETALLEYMQDNNVEKFNLSVKFSRIYLGEHPDVLAKITENSSVRVLYNGITYTLHISSYTYKMKSGDVLPEITVELTDTLSVHQGAIQHAVSQVKDEILSAASGVNAVKQCITYFLRKDIDDQATGRISFANGLSSSKDASFGGFKENSRGAGIFQDASGNWHIEADFMRVRKKLSATTVEIEESHHIGGSQMLTSASAVIDYVIDKGDFYRCYFLKTDESGRTVLNKWEVGDQAYCRYFNLTEDTFYWRKVIDTNHTTTDSTTIEIDGVKIFTAKYHFVDLSKTVCAEGSDVPRAQDNIVQLGYQSEVAEGEEDPNASRKNAIIMAGAGEGSPYICQYMGINSFTLPEPDTQIKPGDNILSGTTKFKTYKDEDKQLNDLDKEIESNFNAINNLETGTNILRNSGFNGDYDVIDLDGDGVLNSNETELFSPSLEYWDTKNVKAEKSDESASGKCVVSQGNGEIKQILDSPLEKGANYIFSFKGKGTWVSIILGENTKGIELNSTIGYYEYKFEAKDNHTDISISMGATTTLMEFSLIRGTISNKTWSANPLDNRKERAEYESLSYLQNLLKANTVINGGQVSTGVVNTGLINMGHYDENGEMMKITAGMSGTYNNDDSVAFFGGGDLAKAIYTVQKYKDNPNYEPTTEELASMAKAVITHGGRAILQDIILRGYVYAEGGVFRGNVYAEDGTFKGRVEATEGVFNGTIVGQSKYGNCTIGIDKENAKSGQEIFHVTSPLRYTANGEPIEDGEYYPTLSFKQEHYFGVGYLVLHLNAFNTSSTELSGWHFSATEDSVDGGTDKVVVRGSYVNIANSDTDKLVEMSPNFFTVKNAACRLFTNTIQLDVDKLPTSSNGLLRGQLYLDGNTLKIKT